MQHECLYVRSINAFFVSQLNLYHFQLSSSKHCVLFTYVFAVPWEQCVLKLIFSSGLLNFHSTHLLSHETDDGVEWENGTS
jgi:hypothetical protein